MREKVQITTVVSVGVDSFGWLVGFGIYFSHLNFRFYGLKLTLNLEHYTQRQNLNFYYGRGI
jgi:hypothetical protein